MRELTDPNDEGDDSWQYCWRGHSYVDALLPLFPPLPPLAEITDSQHCFTGYVPDSDEFIVGYDLWLAGGREPAMAGALAFVKFDDTPQGLRATCLRVERREAIYNGRTLDKLSRQFPDLIEIDLD